MRFRLLTNIVSVLYVNLSVSACTTIFGYVPERPTISDETYFVPTYVEVRKWAYKVQDGYDTRSILNRYAIYAGGVVAVAAAGAIAGLAIYDSGNSVLKGIPIGTAFLAGLLALYDSEEKARIYGLASRYAKDLIILS